MQRQKQRKKKLLDGVKTSDKITVKLCAWICENTTQLKSVEIGYFDSCINLNSDTIHKDDYYTDGVLSEVAKCFQVRLSAEYGLLTFV